MPHPRVMRISCFLSEAWSLFASTLGLGPAHLHPVLQVPSAWRHLPTGLGAPSFSGDLATEQALQWVSHVCAVGPLETRVLPLCRGWEEARALQASP